MIRQMDCIDLVELVSDYVDGALSADDRAAFEHHLADCDGCVGYVSQMRETIHLTGALRVDDVQPDAREALLGAFRDFHRSNY
jgi:anti-sigma factor RsiW